MNNSYFLRKAMESNFYPFYVRGDEAAPFLADTNDLLKYFDSKGMLEFVVNLLDEDTKCTLFAIATAIVSCEWTDKRIVCEGGEQLNGNNV